MMVTLASIIPSLQAQDCFVALGLQNVYFHIALHPITEVLKIHDGIKSTLIQGWTPHGTDKRHKIFGGCRIEFLITV